MDQRHQIIELICTTIRATVADAQIILFGSRARGKYRENSDWDVLVLIDVPKLSPVHRGINYELWQKGLDYGHEINCVVRTVEQWKTNRSLFKHNVEREGILL